MMDENLFRLDACHKGGSIVNHERCVSFYRFCISSKNKIFKIVMQMLGEFNSYEYSEFSSSSLNSCKFDKCNVRINAYGHKFTQV